MASRSARSGQTQLNRNGEYLAMWLLQTLAEFSNVAIRKARIPIKDIRTTIDAWCAVLPAQAADHNDLLTALERRAHRLAFWDAMLWLLHGARM
jgi:predicted nucleic acid-binding protein